jgi:hypothetical protein
MMKDGVYQVITNYFCAAFIVRNGKIHDAAPILWKKINYWITKAKFICNE